MSQTFSRLTSHDSRLYLDAALQDLADDPALVGRERSRLFDADGIARLALVVLVVRHELARLRDPLVIQAVTAHVVDGHDDRLIHLVADDLADLLRPWRLAPESRGLRGAIGGLRRCRITHGLNLRFLSWTARSLPPIVRMLERYRLLFGNLRCRGS